ncbi:CRISPR-associated helicase Cas3' [Paenibacillus alba]|uniref:CRISPR-associated helicase Cas3 n=1 Tax=Paenibacillus alba TaxID=1197127 RepID=A0ABU6G8S3_9BACL|nr:CRISPR-associated helicase Cas3' [Paenibacillus alba]MEC0230020.1 CRISPR-associated helicase Cas3' [Paenibacillus alba]
MGYIAHIRESDGKIQTVEDHLSGVQALAEVYGEKIGVKHVTGLAGLLHDMGKYTNEFRTYLLEAVNNPDAPPKRGSVDHSTAGGKLLHILFHTEKLSMYPALLAEIVGNAIISHHSYLHDYLCSKLESPYLKRVEKALDIQEFERSKRCFFELVMSEAELEVYAAKAAKELEIYLDKPSSATIECKLMFLTKFVFSALIDADRTDTRLFEENKTVESQQDSMALFETYYEKLMKEINAYQSREDAQTPINLLRRDMSDQCDAFAEKPSGIYTLSIPTGGGKTLASLRYALKHARLYGKKRIIYVVPFTTIIEQNARDVRRILDDDVHILEHHSNVVNDADDEDEEIDGLINTRQKLKLAKDNWDSPIIFTTMVQFLNTFYAKGSRNIRRLHNVTESVLIFDEVQKVPVSCVSLFNQALNYLKMYGESSLILCTATQPALDYVERKLDMNADAEMIRNLDSVIDAFKRVEIVDKATDEKFDTDKLVDFISTRLSDVQSVLIILNTKTVVKSLYQKLKEIEVPLYHLSTSMCAAHRNAILAKVRKHLDDNEKVICISTQLIEAGVDVSFDCVIRSLAGLDSIAQAAGRCNRHGKRGIQQVFVIDHVEENLKYLRDIEQGKEISRRILVDLKRDRNEHGGHLLSVQAMEKYFKEFYENLKTKLNYPLPKLSKDMINLLTSEKKGKDSLHQDYKHNKGMNLPLFIANSYRTAAENFKVIDDLTSTVLVPYEDEGKELIAQLNGQETIEDLSRLLRKGQQYSINLFPHEREQLIRNDGLVYLLDGKVLALMETAYHKEYGLDLDNNGNFDLSMF